MKTIKNIPDKAAYRILCAFCLLGVLCVSSCTDAWDDHYNNTVEGSMAGEASLLENIAADADLANFYKVINGIGAADLFNSPQQLTVWAPKGLTSAQVDSIIQVYQNDKIAYEAKYGRTQKWEENKAITQFLQNHVALYARPVSSLTNDTVTMMNKKYMHLKGISATEGSLNGNPFDEALLCNNGIVYKMDHLQTFFPNIREYMEQHAGMDSIMHMIEGFDKYDLDEASSVPGGVVNGKTVYLDSVTILSNDMLSGYDAYLHREDSMYTMVVPTDETWAKLYKAYRPYFNYNPTVNHADSLGNIMTQYQIVRGRFFNISENNKYNRHPQDSLVNTGYYERQSHNPRKNVYYNPFGAGGILNGLQKVDCSNGNVYVDDKGVIAPQTTFFGRQDVSAYYSPYYEIPKDESDVEEMNVTTRQYNTYKADSTIKRAYYVVEVKNKISSKQSSIIYTLPDILSNAYYNIYVVTTPDPSASAAKLSTWFMVQHQEVTSKGSFSSKTYFNNPNPITLADSSRVAGVETLLAEKNANRIFATKAAEIDTLLIQSAVQFPYSGWGQEEGVVKLVLSSVGPSGNKYKDVIYTRTLRFNEFILVPFATKEEAEEAANNKDAFNDDILEANKEN